MSSYVTGRTIEDGQPVDGTGFEVTEGGWLDDRIRERVGSVTSHPTRPIWGIPLRDDDSQVRTVSVVGPGYGGPPAHYHEQSVERFRVRRGALTLRVDDRERTVRAGETATVETGAVHTFRNDGDRRALVTTVIDSPGRLRQVLPTLGGLAHDRSRSVENPLQQACIADALEGNTTFVRSERFGGVASDALAAVGRLAGYRGAYAAYTQPAFWRAHVEQPTARG